MRGISNITETIDKVKFSTITIDDCKKHLNIEYGFIEDDDLLQICLLAAKEYILNYTSLPVEALDQLDSIVIAVLVLVTEYYSNRIISATDSKFNFILKSILDMHRKWL